MAHLQHPRDVGHRQAVFVGGPDRLIALVPQLLGIALKLPLAPGVLLGKGRQVRAGLGRLALGAGDKRIVGRIPANRLA
jgi:hypothetical protein